MSLLADEQGACKSPCPNTPSCQWYTGYNTSPTRGVLNGKTMLFTHNIVTFGSRTISEYTASENNVSFDVT
jgi:hypothetical protein